MEYDKFDCWEDALEDAKETLAECPEVVEVRIVKRGGAYAEFDFYEAFYLTEEASKEWAEAHPYKGKSITR